MSLLDRQAQSRSTKPILEDNYQHITTKQIDYIELLSTKLQLSRASLNAHILSVTKRSFDNDIYLLSRTEASQVIDTFKKWIEQRHIEARDK